MLCYNKRTVIKKKFWLAVFKTLMVFGFFGWVYIVINSEVHPWTLHWQLTHFAKYPHEDTFGEICFAVSFVSFFIYNLMAEPKRFLLVQNKSRKQSDVN